MIDGSGITTNIGENSNDECCICGDEWNGEKGWVLCDSSGCENTVCSKCTSTLCLSVSELFYCPICSGSLASAAATAGGAVATAVSACTALEKLPLSFKTVQKILTNLLKHPDEPKYRKLRLENKSVKELCDLEPVLNILTYVGFVRTQCVRQPSKKTTNVNATADLQHTEEVLLLEGPLPTGQVNELLQILNGLSGEDNIDASCCNGDEKKMDCSKDTNASLKTTTDTSAKRKPSNDASEEATDSDSNKKQKSTEENQL